MLGNLKQMLTDGLCGQPSVKRVIMDQMELMEAACRKCCTVPKIQALEAESAVLSLKNIKTIPKTVLGPQTPSGVF